MAEVYPGSSGRGWCWKCKKAGNNPNFWFEVKPDVRSTPPKKYIYAKSVSDIMS